MIVDQFGDWNSVQKLLCDIDSRKRKEYLKYIRRSLWQYAASRARFIRGDSTKRSGIFFVRFLARCLQNSAYD